VNPTEEIKAYEQMLTVRKFEEATNDLFLEGLIPGSVHLAIGHEAVSVGVCGAIESRDRVSATYRGHGHAVALGVDIRKFFAEMLGRSTGVCGGRAGSMNTCDLSNGLVGCFGIVGGSIAAATGVALGLKIDQQGAVSVAFFGDGAVNQGYFLECLNLAAVLKLPVLYVCENNQYAEYTAMRAGTANGILPRGASFGFPVVQIDGNDVAAVRAAAVDALQTVRRTGTPAMIVAETYRFSGHGRGDPVEYRPPGEFDAWRLRDPITVSRTRLATAGLGEDLVVVEARVAETIATAVGLARQDPWPDLASYSFALGGDR
jgi:TPP-dependent pyruvate/acetoin dehydrogenase alpha subunit